MVTNTRTYGPFGDRKDYPTGFVVPQDETVVGFFVRLRPNPNGNGNIIGAIGVYTV
jgi:hypothetical protein